LKTPVIAFFAALLSLFSCRPQEKEITIEFQLIQDDIPYLNSTPFNKGDTAIAIDLFHFYISEMYLGDRMLSEVLFIDPSDSLYSNYTLAVDKSHDEFSFSDIK